MTIYDKLFTLILVNLIFLTYSAEATEDADSLIGRPGNEYANAGVTELDSQYNEKVQKSCDAV